IPPKYSRKGLSPGREGVFRSLYRSSLEKFLSRTGHDHSRRAQGEILAKGQADFSPVVQRAERPGPIDERVHAMTHENLWAPWRMAYILASKDAPKDEGCFLCKGLADARDREHYIIKRQSRCAVVLNRFPYNNGHLLIAPIAHKGTL